MVLVVSLVLWPGCSRKQEPRRLSGHIFIRVGEKSGEGGHDFSQFLSDWTKLLKERGVVAEGGTKFPTKVQLEKSDVLVLYTSEHEVLSAAERSSIDDFVKGGGGLVLLHDAIRTADAGWLKTVAGGAWDSGASKSRVGLTGIYFQNYQHPIIEGISNFDLDDELSWQLQLAPEANVIASSFRSPTEIVPQLWTYEKPDHRAVVFLPGHKPLTFSLPHVRALILRSIAWVAKKDIDLLTTKAELASLQYPLGGPSAPEQAGKKLKLQRDFDLKLLAAEPLIAKPIYIDWDAKGRMWVALSGQKGGTNGGDSLVVLEDTKGDGRFDRKHVFCEGLSNLTSFVFYRDGVIASQAPEIVWLRDTDGDGAVDKREGLFSGFANTNSAGLINNLHWSVDGWIYAAQGQGGSNEVQNKQGKTFAKIGSGILRFKPDGSAIEMVSAFKGDPGGFDFTWDGELFFSRANGPHVSHVMMPEKFLSRGKVPKATSDKTVEDHSKVVPLLADKRPEYSEASTNGQFNVPSGFLCYQGGAWPMRYENSCFVCEPSVHVVHEDIISTLVEGSIGYEAAKAGRDEFVAGTDLWFRPVSMRYGPDGAMYLLDDYGQAIPYNELRDASRARGNAAIVTDSAPVHGRVWRIQHKRARPFELARMDTASATNLVKALEHPNAWVRMTAQRLLVERGETNVSKMLTTMVLSNRVPYVRVQALWTLQQLHTLRDTNLIAAINDYHPGVQKNGLRVVTERGLPLSTNLEKVVLAKAKDGDDRPKLNALFALQQGGLTKEGRQSVLRHYPEQKDVWSKSAYLGVAMSAPMEFIKEALASDKGDTLRELVATLADHLVETGSRSNAVYLVERLARDPKKAGPSILQGAILDSFTRAESPDFDPEWTPELEKAFETLLDSESSTVRYNALALVNRWDKEHALAEESAKAKKQLLIELRSGKLKDDQRTRIITAVMSIPSIQTDVIPLLAKMFGTNFSAGVQNHIVKEFARSSEPAVATVLIEHFRKLNAEGKQLAVSTLFKRQQWVSTMVDSIEEKQIKPKDLGIQAVSRLRHYPDAALAKRATEAIEAVDAPFATDKEQLIARFRAAFAKPADLNNGKEMYKQNCVACHRLGEKDKESKLKELGPELNGIGVHGASVLLTDILDPNRLVETNYIACNITTRKQEDYYGIIVSENKETLKLRTMEAEPEIQLADIAYKKPLGVSLMPEGFEALGDKNIRDIIAYLIEKSSKAYRTIDLLSAFTADSRKGLYSEQSEKPSVDFTRFGLVTIDSVPFDIVNPSSLGAGKNVVVLKGGSGFAKTLPQEIEIPVGTRAKKIHVLGGVAGWGYPNGGRGTNEPLVRAELVYADKRSEEVIFRNGVEFADYAKRIDVPGSRYVSDLVADGQIRLFSFEPKRTNEISRIILRSFDAPAAPTIVAMTAQVE